MTTIHTIVQFHFPRFRFVRYHRWLITVKIWILSVAWEQCGGPLIECFNYKYDFLTVCGWCLEKKLDWRRWCSAVRQVLHHFAWVPPTSLGWARLWRSFFSARLRLCLVEQLPPPQTAILCKLEWMEHPLIDLKRILVATRYSRKGTFRFSLNSG